MNMYDSSAMYRDACESGKVIYASFYRTLLMLCKVLTNDISIRQYMLAHNIQEYMLYGCNECTEALLSVCSKEENLPTYIVDANYQRYRAKYSRFNLVKIEDLKSIDTLDLIIIMSNYNFNQIAKDLNHLGIQYDEIISIEEFLATLLLE